jgi:hypothetical protein
MPKALQSSRPPSPSHELNCNACGLFCKMVCASFGFGTPTERFALSIVIASAYIHLALNSFLQTIALEYSQLADLLNVRGAVPGVSGAMIARGNIGKAIDRCRSSIK